MFRELKEIFDGLIMRDVPMDQYTTLGVGGPADIMVFPTDEQHLRALVLFASARSLPYLVLGNGTNLLVRDQGIRGMVINTTKGFDHLQVLAKEGDGILVKCQAGVSVPKLSSFCISGGLTGLEFASGIPGTIGGAIIMNAGSYHGEIKDIVHEIKWMTPSGEIVSKNPSELRFSYRRLDCPEGIIVTEALLRLSTGQRRRIREEVARWMTERRRRQPLNCRSAGSVFKNPPEGPAGRIIEEIGLKGVRIGGAMVSQLHANFIINTGGARAREILELIELIRQEVLEKRGIFLELEVRVVGG